MGEEQKISLQTKAMVQKIIDLIFPVAEASSAGDWIKGLGMSAIVILILMAFLGGFTTIADSLAVFPPSRAVLFGAMGALTAVALGITIGIIAETQSRISRSIRFWTLGKNLSTINLLQLWDQVQDQIQVQGQVRALRQVLAIG